VGGPPIAKSPLGIPPSDAQPALQKESFKELVNKLAWAIGSTYGRPYSNIRSVARTVAIALAKDVIRDHGYPGFIKK